MSGGTANPQDAIFASHAVVAEDYANLNLRFGYHFAILDSICGPHRIGQLYRPAVFRRRRGSVSAGGCGPIFSARSSPAWNFPWTGRWIWWKPGCRKPTRP